MDITPSPRILRMLGEIEFAEWQCIAELIDNSIDDFTSIRTSGEPWPGGFKVIVTLPSRSAPPGESEVVIRDTGRGMDWPDMSRAVKAGWSGNDRFDKLGLFGMGFNVSTARLGSKTTVLSTRVGDTSWAGVEIDFDKIGEDFQAADLEEPKEDLSEHGTIITISRLKRQQAEWLQRNAQQLREMLGRVYSWILTNTAIEIWVAGVQVKPRLHCIWSEDRYVTFGSGDAAEQVPAVIKIDQPYAPADACMYCGNWQDKGKSTCDDCGSTQLAARERRIHGWVGIQRHLDKRDFGLDFLRNGRKILTFDKRVFEWTNPDDPVGGTSLEYPVDLAHLGGRIVGEIHLDHVPVTYSKDAFEFADRSWRAALEFIRGAGPLLPHTAKRSGYDRNDSPIGKLVRGYRRPDAGRRSLIPGDGSGPIHETTRDWARKYWAGEAGFQSDQKWWEAVLSHEQRKLAAVSSSSEDSDGQSADERTVLDALGANSPFAADSSGDENKSAGTTEPSPQVETLQERVARLSAGSTPIPELSVAYSLIEMGAVEVSAVLVSVRPMLDENSRETPVWLRPGSGNSLTAFIDPGHELFSKFGTSYEDALLMELVPFMKVRASSNMPSAEVHFRLRASALSHTAIDQASVKTRAADLLDNVRAAMADIVAGDPSRAVQYLRPDERSTIENSLASDGIPITAAIWDNGGFIEYAPPLYVARLVEEWPEVFFDGSVFRSSYSSLNSPSARRLSAARVVGYLNDLGALLASQAKQSIAQLQRARWSCTLLSDEIVDYA